MYFLVPQIKDWRQLKLVNNKLPRYTSLTLLQTPEPNKVWQLNQTSILYLIILWEPSVNRKYLQAFTLVVPTRNNKVLDPLSVLHLDNWLYSIGSYSSTPFIFYLAIWPLLALWFNLMVNNIWPSGFYLFGLPVSKFRPCLIQMC